MHTQFYGRKPRMPFPRPCSALAPQPAVVMSERKTRSCARARGGGEQRRHCPLDGGREHGKRGERYKKQDNRVRIERVCGFHAQTGGRDHACKSRSPPYSTRARALRGGRWRIGGCGKYRAAGGKEAEAGHVGRARHTMRTQSTGGRGGGTWWRTHVGTHAHTLTRLGTNAARSSWGASCGLSFARVKQRVAGAQNILVWNGVWPHSGREVWLEKRIALSCHTRASFARAAFSKWRAARDSLCAHDYSSHLCLRMRGSVLPYYSRPCNWIRICSPAGRVCR